MTHSRKPQSLTKYTGFQEEVLAYLNDIQDEFRKGLKSIESMIAGSQQFAYAVATSEYRRDLKQMADLTKLNSTVSKMTSIAESVKAMNDGLKAERDTLKAENTALKAADAIDQVAIDANEVKLAEVTAALEALTAVAVNTPVGGSVAGNLEPT